MAFKYIAFFALLSLANAGGIATYVNSPLLTKIVNPSVDAVASTQQNVVRSFGGTVSTYSKAVDTPYSSVRKTDTRINNNVYTPTVAKTLTYAAPSANVYSVPGHLQSVHAAAPAVYAAPGLHASPAAITKTIYTQQAPLAYTHAAPSTAYTHAAPTTVLKAVIPAAPVATTNINHGPSATTYTHNAPGVSGYSASQTIHYSPAEMVSHMSFDGFGTHWGY